MTITCFHDLAEIPDGRDPRDLIAYDEVRARVTRDGQTFDVAIPSIVWGDDDGIPAGRLVAAIEAEYGRCDRVTVLEAMPLGPGPICRACGQHECDDLDSRCPVTFTTCPDVCDPCLDDGADACVDVSMTGAQHGLPLDSGPADNAASLGLGSR